MYIRYTDYEGSIIMHNDNNGINVTNVQMLVILTQQVFEGNTCLTEHMFEGNYCSDTSVKTPIDRKNKNHTQTICTTLFHSRLIYVERR